jgi:hypothetical protein
MAWKDHAIEDEYVPENAGEWLARWFDENRYLITPSERYVLEHHHGEGRPLWRIARDLKLTTREVRGMRERALGIMRPGFRRWVERRLGLDLDRSSLAMALIGRGEVAR